MTPGGALRRPSRDGRQPWRSSPGWPPSAGRARCHRRSGSGSSCRGCVDRSPERSGSRARPASRRDRPPLSPAPASSVPCRQESTCSRAPPRRTRARPARGRRSARPHRRPAPPPSPRTEVTRPTRSRTSIVMALFSRRRAAPRWLGERGALSSDRVRSSPRCVLPWHVPRRPARLGVRGWVRNRRDGTVELVAEGSRDAVGELIARRRARTAAR